MKLTFSSIIFNFGVLLLIRMQFLMVTVKYEQLQVLVKIAPTHENEPADGGLIDRLLPAVHDGVVGGGGDARQAEEDEDSCIRYRYVAIKCHGNMRQKCFDDFLH